MTSFHSALGMLLLAGLMLACSAHCFGLLRRPGGSRYRGRRMAWPLVLAAALPGAALAQASGAASQGQGQAPGRGPGAAGGGRLPPGPPPEAVAACQNKASGAACAFTDHGNNARSGLCRAAPPSAAGATASAETLACGPAMGASPGGPPPARS